MNFVDQEGFSEDQRELLEYLKFRYKNYEIINVTSEDLRELSKKFHCEFEKVEEVYNFILQSSMERLRNCNELIQEYMEFLHLVSTGNPEIDKLLNGGFYSSQLLEIVGASGSGKTEFCLNLLKTGYKTTQDKFLYLDSGQSFCYFRLAKMLNLEENGTNMAALKEKVCHKTFLNKKELFFHLSSIVSTLEKMPNPFQNPLRYIIIDNFTMSVYPINDFIEYDLWMAELPKLFRTLCNKFFIGILVTTLCRSEKKEFFGTRKKRVLPPPWNFHPNISLFVEKTKTLNPEKTQISFVTKYSLLQNEYNDPLRTVKVIENLVFK